MSLNRGDLRGYRISSGLALFKIVMADYRQQCRLFHRSKRRRSAATERIIAMFLSPSLFGSMRLIDFTQ
jgi:hypothetical protein